MKHLKLLCVILSLYGSGRVTAESNSLEEDIPMQEPNDFVEICDKRLDEETQWDSLNAALKNIQELLYNFQGKAGVDMKALREENTQAHDEFVLAVGPLFQWCESVKNHTASVIQKPTSSVNTRSYMTEVTRDSLLGGVKYLKDFMSHMKQAIHHMSALDTLLSVADIQLNADFRSNGYYGIERSRLVNVVALLPVEVDEGMVVTTLKQRITVIDKLFNELVNALNHAKQECKKVHEALEIELQVIQNINLLASRVQTPQPNDVMTAESSSLFIDSLNKLSGSCKRYVKSHL